MAKKDKKVVVCEGCGSRTSYIDTKPTHCIVCGVTESINNVDGTVIKAEPIKIKSQ